MRAAFFFCRTAYVKAQLTAFSLLHIYSHIIVTQHIILYTVEIEDVILF